MTKTIKDYILDLKNQYPGLTVEELLAIKQALEELSIAARNEGFDDGEKFGRAEGLNDQKKWKPRFIDKPI